MLILYRPLYLLWFLLMKAVSPFVAKVRRGLRGRQDLARHVRALRNEWSSSPYWFHFASSGEFEQAIPILDALRRQEPQCRIFLSYFSPSGRRALSLEVERRAKAHLPVPWDGADFSPLDFPKSVREYWDALRPKALIVMNREFWPELFEEGFRRGTRIYVFAAFLSRRSRRVVRWFRPWLERVTYLGTVDTSTATFLREELSNPAVEAVGDPRVERVLERRLFTDAARLTRLPSPSLVAASVWPEDFDALRPSLEMMLRDPGHWTVFLVPHEPEEGIVFRLENWAKGLGLRSVRWSARSTVDSLPSVVIVDTVGWLAELYRHATWAFVGGSFRGRVHNVLEPAAYGVPILTGPYIDNSLEATEMEKSGALYRAQNGADLHACMKSWLVASETATQRGQAALSFLEGRSGVGSRYCDILLN